VKLITSVLLFFALVAQTSYGESSQDRKVAHDHDGDGVADHGDEAHHDDSFLEEESFFDEGLDEEPVSEVPT